MRIYSQRELVWDDGRPHASDLRAAIRKVAHNTRTGQYALIDRRGRVPLNPEALAPRLILDSVRELVVPLVRLGP